MYMLFSIWYLLFCLIAHTQWKSDVTSSEHLARTSLKSLLHLRIGSHTFALWCNPRVMAMENARICTMCVNQHHSNTEQYVCESLCEVMTSTAYWRGYWFVKVWEQSYNFLKPSWDFDTCTEYVVKAQTSLSPLSRFRGSRVTTAHAHQIHQCCIFQSYAKTVPSQMKLTMKLTMREPTFMGSMTTDTWSWRVKSDFYSVLAWFTGLLRFENNHTISWSLYEILITCTVGAPVFGTLSSVISNFQTWFVRTVIEVLKYCWM